MSDEPLVSVIAICYNHAAFLADWSDPKRARAAFKRGEIRALASMGVLLLVLSRLGLRAEWRRAPVSRER